MINKTDRAFEAAEAALDRTEDDALKIDTITDKPARILEPGSKKTGSSKTTPVLFAVAAMVAGRAVFAAA